MMDRLNHKRSWDVLLVGGASGVGKTCVSYRLARHFDVGITEIDDFQVILERMTTPEQQPVLHYWRTLPPGTSLTAQEIVTHTLKVCRVMASALEWVIANHLEERTPLILEGDFILPELIVRETFGETTCNGRVQGLFIHEPDLDQLVQNFSQREPDEAPQVIRAEVSALYSHWLMQEAIRLHVPVIAARPWDTVFERCLDVLTP